MKWARAALLLLLIALVGVGSYLDPSWWAGAIAGAVAVVTFYEVGGDIEGWRHRRWETRPDERRVIKLDRNNGSYQQPGRRGR